MNSQAPLRLVPEPSPVPTTAKSVRWVGAVEAIALFGIIFAIERFELLDLSALPIHPIVLVIALLAAQYGALAGVLVTFAATLLTFAGGFQHVRVIGEGYFEYIGAVWAQPLSWLLMAVLVGMATDRIRRSLRNTNENLAAIARERDLIAHQYDALSARAKRLERRAAGFEGAPKRSSGR